jgi:hypothetical protein
VLGLVEAGYFVSTPSEIIASVDTNYTSAWRSPLHEQLVQEDGARTPFLNILLRIACIWCCWWSYWYVNPKQYGPSNTTAAGLIVDNFQHRGSLPAWKWLFLSM